MIPASFWTLARFACRTECPKRAAGDHPQHSGDGNDAEAASDVQHQRRRGDPAGNQPHGGVVGDGHFGRGAWISLCSALDMPIPQEGASEEEGQILLRTGDSSTASAYEMEVTDSRGFVFCSSNDCVCSVNGPCSAALTLQILESCGLLPGMQFAAGRISTQAPYY